MQQICGSDGKLGLATTCSFPCSGNVCGVCAVGDTHCKDASTKETCSSANVWSMV